jgi:lipoate-protein ligase A
MSQEVIFEKYNLPDIDLLDQDQINLQYFLWQPDRTYIVLGKSNDPESSLHLDLAQNDKVSITKRPSGGESVILSDKTLVIAFVSENDEYNKPLDFFRKSNLKIMKALEKWPGVKDLHQRGISDISVNNIKIAGSAIYRNQDKLFYHCVLNVSEDISLFERYLKHPKREPDYRQGRSHSNFATNLQQLGYEINISDLIRHFDQEFKTHVIAN